MSKFVLTVFDDEKAAYEGSQAIKDLHNEGSIVAYAGAVIFKDADGVVQVKNAADEGPAGTATGMLVGSLVGALAGPAGMAVGAATGTMSGWLVDLYNVGVDAQFLDDVNALLAPGKYAVVAEIAEGWTAPLDTKMEALGGTVMRRYRIDVEDEQIERDIEATNRELEELEEEWDNAIGEAKAKLKAKVDASRERLASLKARATEKVEALQAESKARLDKLNDQIAAAKADFKEKFEKRKAEITADYEKRTEKLNKATSLTTEAAG